ncbi:MAG: DNA gyrase inhibitor YacG [Defluviicoccus sp.]|nr:DNA gyrase inhibitor YacG [Defluviicoccus sp.]MDE0382988.1 DNA gyrase inhibitor YacG [Defluviicoccus sp.]
MTGRPDPCPICGRPGHARHLPFCSPRCREIDLGRWFSGAYAVPAVEPPDDLDEDGFDG